jgi:hypothetical protein
MFEQHPSFDTPPDSTTVWRYTSLVKLLDLLATKQLHLSKLEDLDDPHEGYMPPDHCRAQWPCDIPDAVINQVTAATTAIARKVFVSCWHIANQESDVLWNRYSDRSGVAIESTLGGLKTGVIVDTPMYIGRVSYLDYSSTSQVIDSRNMYNQALSKRIEFEADSELRLVASTPLRPEQSRVRLGIHLDRLISRVHVAPRVPEWEARAILSACRALDYRGDVRRSSLYERPPSPL